MTEIDLFDKEIYYGEIENNLYNLWVEAAEQSSQWNDVGHMYYNSWVARYYHNSTLSNQNIEDLNEKEIKLAKVKRDINELRLDIPNFSFNYGYIADESLKILYERMDEAIYKLSPYQELQIMLAKNYLYDKLKVSITKAKYFIRRVEPLYIRYGNIFLWCPDGIVTIQIENVGNEYQYGNPSGLIKEIIGRKKWRVPDEYYKGKKSQLSYEKITDTERLELRPLILRELLEKIIMLGQGNTDLEIKIEDVKFVSEVAVNVSIKDHPECSGRSNKRINTITLEEMPNYKKISKYVYEDCRYLNANLEDIIEYMIEQYDLPREIIVGYLKSNLKSLVGETWTDLNKLNLSSRSN